MRRIGLIVLVIAILLGGGALWGVISLQGHRAALHETTVVVAARPIQLGQALTPDLMRMQAWPADALPEGAFTQVSQLTTGQARVALRAIEPNEPILASRISGAGGRATLSATITAGHRAVAIRVNDVVGVAGFVLPGDFVDVLLTRQNGSGYNNNQDMQTDLLIANVRVLGVDQISSENRNDPQVARAVTIEVTPEDGQKVALAGQIGTLSLALRRADDIAQPGANTPTPETIRIQDLRAEAAARAHTPVAPARAVVRRAPISGNSIEIIRGFATNRAAVATE